MTNTKWTRGPWFFDGTGPHNVFGCEINNALGECIDGSWHGRGDVAKANARLISAAPELYEALDNILQNTLSNQSEQGQVVVMKARAALAKARGETK